MGRSLEGIAQASCCRAHSPFQWRCNSENLNSTTPPVFRVHEYSRIASFSINKLRLSALIRPASLAASSFPIEFWLSSMVSCMLLISVRNSIPFSLSLAAYTTRAQECRLQRHCRLGAFARWWRWLHYNIKVCFHCLLVRPEAEEVFSSALLVDIHLRVWVWKM